VQIAKVRGSVSDGIPESGHEEDVDSAGTDNEETDQEETQE
jgi:hypothetical protein